MRTVAKIKELKTPEERTMNIVRNYPLEEGDFSDKLYEEEIRLQGEGTYCRIITHRPSLAKAMQEAAKSYGGKPKIKTASDSVRFSYEVLKRMPKQERQGLTPDRLADIIRKQYAQTERFKRGLNFSECVMELGSSAKFELVARLYFLLKDTPEYTPYKLFASKNAPEGLREKQKYNAAINELISDGWLMKKPTDKKRSVWSINTKKLLEKGIDLDKIKFEEWRFNCVKK